MPTDNHYHPSSRHALECSILAEVAEHGGFPIFWSTENQARAAAADRLVEGGYIIRQKDNYPWCSYRLAPALETVVAGMSKKGKITKHRLLGVMMGLTPSTAPNEDDPKPCA